MRNTYFRSAFKQAAAGLAILFLLSACAPAPRRSDPPAVAATPPPYQIERIKRDLQLPPTVKRVHINNPHGSVGIKAIDNRTLGAYEVVQLIGATPEKPDIQMRLDGDTAVVEVSYASDRRHGADTLVNGFRKGRVDLGMFLPEGPELQVTTTFGDIQVRRINNEVVARTRDGKLMVAGGGSVDAATESGDLRVFPTNAKWRKPMKLKTVSGNILMEVPMYGQIQLDAETAGAFGGQVELQLRDAGTDRKHGQLTRGDGSQHIRIDSDSGDIYLIPMNAPPH